MRGFASANQVVSRNCSSILPPDARSTLVLAASDCKKISDPEKRAAAIDDAIAFVRRKYPQFFIWEPQNATSHA